MDKWNGFIKEKWIPIEGRYNSSRLGEVYAPGMKIYSTQRWDNKEELQAERGHVGIHTITGERARIRGQ